MKTNFFDNLNELNSSLNVGKSIAKKYDYASANISKVQQKSFRIKVRKITESFYSKEQTEQTVKSFAAMQEQILLVCTEGKKKFQNLSVSDIYPNFENLSVSEKNLVTELHEKAKSFFIASVKEEKKVENK